MTMESFQRALSDLIASPDFCAQVRASPAAALAPYGLEPRERRRLQTVVWQRGMSLNCSLYRQNRVTPIYTLLQYTCLTLGERFADELELYWNSARYDEVQFALEIERFAGHLRRRMAEGDLNLPYLREILDFELAWNQLEFGYFESSDNKDGDAATREKHVRVVRFAHNPLMLLHSFAKFGQPPSEDLPEEEFLLRLEMSERGVQMALVDATL